MLVLVALDCALHATRITLHVYHIDIVDTLRILIDNSHKNEKLRLAQVAIIDGKIE